MLMLAKAGKLNGYLLEGMACPGGCVAGAGTLREPGEIHCRAEQIQGQRTGEVFSGQQIRDHAQPFARLTAAHSR